MSRPLRGDPAWDVALLFPRQGEWSETDYLALDTNRLIELSNGCLEVLPMPTVFHQLLVQFLFMAFHAHADAHAPGLVLMAPLPIRLWRGKFREPDLVYIKRDNIGNLHHAPEGADLVVEVLSEGEESRRRDLEIKREEYAQAGIPEYWTVDRDQRLVTVLWLHGAIYQVHGQFQPGQTATSPSLQGLTVDVTALFATENRIPPAPKPGPGAGQPAKKSRSALSKRLLR